VANFDTKKIRERLLEKIAVRGMDRILLLHELGQEGYRQAFFELQDLRRQGLLFEVEYEIDGAKYAMVYPQGTKMFVQGRYGQNDVTPVGETKAPVVEDGVNKSFVLDPMGDGQTYVEKSDAPPMKPLYGDQPNEPLVKDIPESQKPYHGLTPPKPKVEEPLVPRYSGPIGGTD
jgi:hypothetical protein